MSRSKILGAIFALPLLIAGAGSAQANIIALNIDVSGSISNADFLLQRNAYAAVLGSSLLSTDGTNSVGVWKFDNNVNLVFAITNINSVAAKNNLIAAINAMTQTAGSTAIGDSINVATAAIQAFAAIPANCVVFGSCANKIIDVSTDGQNNFGANPNTATTAANGLGIAVNCLGVGGAADCSWNNGGLDFIANNAAAFQAALTLKLTKELYTPEPLTMSLFGAGLVGAAALRRRKNKTA